MGRLFLSVGWENSSERGLKIVPFIPLRSAATDLCLHCLPMPASDLGLHCLPMSQARFYR